MVSKRVFLFATLMMLCSTALYAQVPVLGGQVGVLQMATDTSQNALGTADLTNNSAIVGQVQVTSGTGWAVGTAENMRTWLQQGYAGTVWNGLGIQSSTAAADPNLITGINWAYGQAYIDLVGQTTFHGVTVKPGDILMSYGYYGDLNFDGQVLSDDYGLLDTAYSINPLGCTVADFNAAAGSSYQSLGTLLGDGNYDGLAASDDYGNIDTGYAVGPMYGIINPAYTLGGGPLAVGQAAVVPEPSVMVLLLGVFAFLGLKLRSNFFHN